MRNHRYAGGAVALSLALTLSALAEAKAQTDTTRRATSEQRIPVRKEQGAEQVTRRESAGDVRLPSAMSRIDSLEALAASYRGRIDALEAANASLTSRSEATDRLIAALSDSLRMVRGELTTARAELTTVRGELAATTARTAALGDSLYQLNQRFILFRTRSLFGNSGFYVGLGTGFNLTTGALNDMGYVEGLHIAVPIGWQKPGSMIGVRTEWAFQNVDGRLQGAFNNIDPNIYSAIGMVTLHVPFNAKKTNTIYLMGGGGVYHFRDIGAASSLSASFAGSQEGPTTETKWGLTGGAGVEFHVLGATSLFAESAFTTVSADRVVAPGTSRNLRWVPLIFGVMLR
jgi:opacity protein-like surface antigen